MAYDYLPILFPFTDEYFQKYHRFPPAFAIVDIILWIITSTIIRYIISSLTLITLHIILIITILSFCCIQIDDTLRCNFVILISLYTIPALCPLMMWILYLFLGFAISMSIQNILSYIFDIVNSAIYPSEICRGCGQRDIYYNMIKSCHCLDSFPIHRKCLTSFDISQCAGCGIKYTDKMLTCRINSQVLTWCYVICIAARFAQLSYWLTGGFYLATWFSHIYSFCAETSVNLMAHSMPILVCIYEGITGF